MARTTATNFTGLLQFPYATAGTDIFRKEDVQTLAQAVDQHDHSTGKGLVLSAASIPPITSAMIADGTITSTDIADGTIQTVDIAANAVQQVLGSYLASPTFSTTTTATWLATPVTVPVTSAGGTLRVDGFLTLTHSAVNGGGLVALYRGAAAVATLAYASSPSGVSTPSTVSFTLYDSPGAGALTYTVYLYNAVGGTFSIYAGVSASLYVVEQKR